MSSAAGRGIEQQPSKLKVAGSNPAGVATQFSGQFFQWVNRPFGSLGSAVSHFLLPI